MAKIKYSIGDIVMIPVSDTDFVFGRLLKDSSIAIYPLLSTEAVDISQLVRKKILFDPGVFDTNIVNGKWKIIGHIPFEHADESWPSPKCIRDIINPDKCRIYYKGEMKPATEKEVKGLEEQAMFKPEGLVAEIQKRLPIS